VRAVEGVGNQLQSRGPGLANALTEHPGFAALCEPRDRTSDKEHEEHECIPILLSLLLGGLCDNSVSVVRVARIRQSISLDAAAGGARSE
jgi:hypothetical protein